MRKIAFLLAASGSWLLASVDGTVINGTTGKPQASVMVSLMEPGGGGLQTLQTLKTDAEGKFNFNKDLPPGPAVVQAIFQGATYNLVLTPGTPPTGLQVKIYDSTSKAGVAKVSQHLVLIEPSATSLDVSETFLIENASQTTFEDPVKGSAEFYLPAAADGKVKVVVNAPGGLPVDRDAAPTRQKNVFKIDYPVKPGETRFDVSYSLPPSDKFAGKIPHNEGVTRVVTPSSVTLAGDGIESLGQEPQTGAHIYNATAPDYAVTITGLGSLRNQDAQPAPSEDTGEPQIEEKAARVYTRMGWVMGLAFAILALGGVLLYRKSSA